MRMIEHCRFGFCGAERKDAGRPGAGVARVAAVLLVLTILAAAAIPAATAAPKGTGLPLPRYVSLRAGEVNLRTGPGLQYPVDWVYKRRDLPIEVVAEFATWRKVRDWQGTQGWVHQSMVGSRRSVVITGQSRVLRERSQQDSAPVARLQDGVIGRLMACPADRGWCRVRVGGYEGWLRRDWFWGVYTNEVVE